MDLSTQQFFALLRAGLWNTPVDMDLFRSKPVDWQFIYDTAKRQTVLGIVADGMEKLPKEMRPGKELLQEWIVQVIRIECRNRDMNTLLPRLFKLFKNAGIRVFLLKGQGIARLYPHPLRRQSGDIDLFVEKKDYLRAKELIKCLPVKNENEVLGLRHYDCVLGYTCIELHGQINTSQKNFESWLYQQINTKPLLHYGEEECPVTLLPAGCDVIFILAHFLRHFIAGGVGLRQLCDWNIYLYTLFKKQDLDSLEKDLEKLGLMKAWEVFGCLSVHFLGYPLAYMPFFTEHYQPYEQKIIEDILRAGNFGKYEDFAQYHTSNYLLRKIHSFTYKIPHLCRFYKLFPEETLYHLTRFFVIGTRYFLKGR